MERQPSLLLVEDEDGLRGLVAAFLRAAGYVVVEAADGPAAVDRFGDSGPFDLAIVDLNLPGFSGVEVCRRLRAARPDQPILICSAAVLPDFEGALRQLGVEHILTKPFHPDALLAHIAGRLHGGRGRATPRQVEPARAAPVARLAARGAI